MPKNRKQPVFFLVPKPRLRAVSVTGSRGFPGKCVPKLGLGNEKTRKPGLGKTRKPGLGNEKKIFVFQGGQAGKKSGENHTGGGKSHKGFRLYLIFFCGNAGCPG